MRFSKDKTINEIVRELIKAGWRVKSTKNHVRLANSVTSDVITVPTSPSDCRARQNWLHQVKRYCQAAQTPISAFA